MLVELLQQVKMIIHALQLEPQLLGDRDEQHAWLQHRIGQVGDHLILVQRCQKTAAQQGLAGADFARDLDEALTRIEADQERVERFLVGVGGIDETGIRRDAERKFAQAEVVEVHRADPRNYCGRRPDG